MMYHHVFLLLVCTTSVFSYSCVPAVPYKTFDGLEYLKCDNGRSCQMIPEILGNHELPKQRIRTILEEEKSPSNSTNSSEKEKVECIRIDEHTILCGLDKYSTTEMVHPGTSIFFFYVFGTIFLILAAGMMSGLQLGILSLDMNSLAVLERAGEENDKKRAKRVRPLLARRHLMMVTLLIANAGCLETLPLLLDKLMDPVGVILLSVTAVLLFGEIIPQALCCRFGLAIGASLSPIVWFLIAITFPISYPIAKLLDAMLGSHASFFRRNELSELIKLQEQQGKGDEKLTEDEATIIRGALQLSQKTVGDCMTPIEKVFMLEIDAKLDLSTMKHIQRDGHSRIPIYRETRDNIIGMLLVKQLILVDPEDGIPVNSLTIRRIPTVSTKKALYELLNLFQTGKSHMAEVVSAEDHMTVVGVVTLEDIIEELIQEEIVDEAELHSKKWHTSDLPISPVEAKIEFEDKKHLIETL